MRATCIWLGACFVTLGAALLFPNFQGPITITGLLVINFGFLVHMARAR